MSKARTFCMTQSGCLVGYNSLDAQSTQLLSVLGSSLSVTCIGHSPLAFEVIQLNCFEN